MAARTWRGCSCGVLTRWALFTLIDRKSHRTMTEIAANFPVAAALLWQLPPLRPCWMAFHLSTDRVADRSCLEPIQILDSTSDNSRNTRYPSSLQSHCNLTATSSFFTAIPRRCLVRRLAAYAAMHPSSTSGLRFDVTSKKVGGTPSKDISTVFRAAMQPWDTRKYPKLR